MQLAKRPSSQRDWTEAGCARGKSAVPRLSSVATSFALASVLAPQFIADVPTRTSTQSSHLRCASAPPSPNAGGSGSAGRSSHSRRSLTSGFRTPTGPSAPLQPGLNVGRVHLAVVANRPLHRDCRGQVVELLGATGGLRQQPGAPARASRSRRGQLPERAPVTSPTGARPVLWTPRTRQCSGAGPSAFAALAGLCEERNVPARDHRFGGPEYHPQYHGPRHTLGRRGSTV